MQLIIKNLSQKIGHKKIFSDISFTVDTGEIVGLVGRNGCGKTTLLQTVIGIIKTQSGEISCTDLQKNETYLDKIIFVPDKFDYFKYEKLEKVFEYYKVVYSKFDKNKFLDMMREIDMQFNTKMNMGNFSKGELTICATLLAISTNINFILLDEPYDGIDVVNAQKLNQLLNKASEEQIGIIISSHRLEVLSKMSNKTLFLETGKQVKEFSEDNNRDYYKFQLILKEDKMPSKILGDSNIVILSSIGRVNTIVINGDKNKYIELFESIENIIQYDELKVTLEDIFMWQDVRKEVK